MELGVKGCSASRSPGDPGSLLISNLSSGWVLSFLLSCHMYVQDWAEVVWSMAGQHCHNKDMRTRSAGTHQFWTICHCFQSGNSWGKNLQATGLLWEGIPICPTCPLFILLPVLRPCQELDLGLHRLLVWPSVAVLMFLCFVKSLYFQNVLERRRYFKVQSFFLSNRRRPRRGSGV